MTLVGFLDRPRLLGHRRQTSVSTPESGQNLTITASWEDLSKVTMKEEKEQVTMTKDLGVEDAAFDVSDLRASLEEVSNDIASQTGASALGQCLCGACGDPRPVICPGVVSAAIAKIESIHGPVDNGARVALVLDLLPLGPESVDAVGHVMRNKACTQLALVWQSSEMARSIRFLATGKAKEHTQQAFGPCRVSPLGCWIPARDPGKKRHLEFRPYGRTERAGRGSAEEKRCQQYAQRQVVRAFGRLNDILRITSLSPGGNPFEVSHLCGFNLCIRGDHLIVERHGRNELRKKCHDLGQCVCGLVPRCIV